MPRGSPTQMKQLAGMRGLMTKPSGEIIETPIISNFKEGLSVLEYFNSTHGARKGLADTALKTANSGYLTRRLVDVAQDCIITEDCGTDERHQRAGRVDSGRSSCRSRPAFWVAPRPRTCSIPRPSHHHRPVWRADRRAPARADRQGAGIQERAYPLGADLRDRERACCGKCYGRDLARGTPVNIGEAVGVIAAQSIGEPGTQLTMRTFHIGGAAQRGRPVVHRSRTSTARCRSSNRNVARKGQPEPSPRLHGRNDAIVIVGSGRQGAGDNHKIPYGARLHKVDEGDTVKRGTRLGRVGPVYPADPQRDRRRRRFRGPGRGRLDVGADRRGEGHPTASWSIGAQPRALRSEAGDHHQGQQGRQDRSSCTRGGDARYLLPVDSILSVEPTARRSRPVTCWPVSRSRLQVGRHHRRSAARRRAVRGPASEGSRDHRGDFTGTVEFGKDYKNKQRIVDQARRREPKSRRVPDPEAASSIAVQHGDVIEKGEYIVYDGHPAPHDILAIKGVEELAELPDQRDPGRLPSPGRDHQRQAHRSDRSPDAAEDRDHRTPGDTATSSKGEQIDRTSNSSEANRKLENGRQARSAKAQPVLLGITKASLADATRSSQPPRSRRRRASSPTPPSTARSTRSTASRRTSSSAVSSRPAPARRWPSSAASPVGATISLSSSAPRRPNPPRPCRPRSKRLA